MVWLMCRLLYNVASIDIIVLIYAIVIVVECRLWCIIEASYTIFTHLATRQTKVAVVD